MQRTLLLKSFLVALVFLVSVPWAQAQKRGGGGAGRINKLSGPGPFNAVGGVARFRLNFNGIYPKGKIDGATGHDILRNTPIWLVFGFIYAQSEENRLMYPANFSEDTQVKFVSFETALDFRLNENIPVEIGGGLALRRFTGDAFDTFWSVSLGPRIGWRFLEPIKGSGRWQDFWDGWRLQFNVMIDPRGFKVEDFGALLGTFDSGVEAVPQLILSWDFNPNRKIFEARKRETAALGTGEKLVLGHPLAATIGDSARCMQNLEKVLFTGPKTSDTVTFICD